MINLAKLLLAAEAVILAGRYIEANTVSMEVEIPVENGTYREQERVQDYGPGSEQSGAQDLAQEELFGIGFRSGEGTMFWFRKKTTEEERTQGNKDDEKKEENLE